MFAYQQALIDAALLNLNSSIVTFLMNSFQSFVNSSNREMSGKQQNLMYYPGDDGLMIDATLLTSKTLKMQVAYDP